MPDQNSRTARRQQQRGGSKPPPKRDPMTAIYAGLAVVVVLIVAGLAIMRWQQTRALDAAYATPTPAPSSAATTKPIQLTDGMVLGKPLIKTAALSADTPAGGQGQPVDGIPCAEMEYAGLHVHTHLAIFYNGVQVQVPRLVGGAAPPGKLQCLYWVHTHFQDGIIHVESPQLAPPNQAGFTLANFFDIWGQPLQAGNVAGFKGPVTAYVNGVRYDGDLRQIPLASHQQIVLEVGKPVPPPNYQFPPND